MSEGMMSLQAARDELFLLMSEQLKLPLLQIRELASLGQDNLLSIIEISSGTLRLLDAYSYAAQCEYGQLELELQPITSSALITAALYAAQPLANLYGVDIQTKHSGGKLPAITSSAGVGSLLYGLLYALVESSTTRAKKCVTLVSRQNKDGVHIGVYMAEEGSDIIDRKVRRQHASVSLQPLHQLTHSAGAGFYIANSLAQSLGITMRAVTSKHKKGFTILLPLSQQSSLW
jgi:hypothetical protein